MSLSENKSGFLDSDSSFLKGFYNKILIFFERNRSIAIGVSHLEPDSDVVLGRSEVSHTHFSIGSRKKLGDFVFLEVTTAVLVESLEESSSDIELGLNFLSVFLSSLLNFLFSNNVGNGLLACKVSNAEFFNITISDSTITISVEDSVVSLNIFRRRSEERVEGFVSFSDHGDAISVLNLALSALVVILEDSSGNLLSTLIEFEKIMILGKAIIKKCR